MKPRIDFRNVEFGIPIKNIAVGMGVAEGADEGPSLKDCSIIRLADDRFESGEPLPPLWFVSKNDPEKRTVTIVDVTGAGRRTIMDIRPVFQLSAKIVFGDRQSTKFLSLSKAQKGDCFNVAGVWHMVVDAPDKAKEGKIFAVPLNGGDGDLWDGDWKHALYQDVRILIPPKLL